MEIKLFEIRDRGTCIAAMAIKMGGWENPRETKLLARAGFGQIPDDHERYILLADMDGGTFKMSSDAYEWGRTMKTAHLYIEEQWNRLVSGDLVDVEFILGERDTVKETDLQ